ncbi:MAG: response regulator transcription factor [Flavobacteriales bacterium]|mgnify:CR=1 FL=1|nr:response regulator transcription factor [Flavobacteriales bacterium]
MIRVLIYEDNNELRGSLAQLIDSSEGMLCIANFVSCVHAEEEVNLLTPNVVLMDIDMPGITGIEGVGIIKKARPETHIIMLTVFDDNERVFQSICAGASGYLLKRTPNEKIIDAIRDVQTGGAPMTSRIAKQVLQLFSQKLSAPKASGDYNLTKREHETLSWLVKGFSYKMIAEKMEVSIDTVRAHIKKIYEKLHVHSMNEAVAKAIKQGIV